MVLQDSCRWWKYFRHFVFIIFTLVFFVIIYLPPDRFTPSKEDSSGKLKNNVSLDSENSRENRLWIPDVVGWEVGVVRDTRVYIVPANETTLLGRTQVCSKNTLLCIVVTSAPMHYDARQAIRNTWAADLPPNVVLAFLLGVHLNSTVQSQIEEENERHKDIIQEDFIDSYNNLTIKSVFMLKWFNAKCPDAKFLVKSDDDMYLNVTGFVDLVSTLNQTTGIIMGSLIRNARPILNHRNKWYSPRYMFGGSRYPDYVSGTTYLMSSDVVGKLYNAALSTPIFHLEDVFITGICAKEAGLKSRGDRRFSYVNLEVGCHRHLVAIHEFTPSQLIEAWSSRFTCSRPRPTRTTSS